MATRSKLKGKAAPGQHKKAMKVSARAASLQKGKTAAKSTTTLSPRKRPRRADTHNDAAIAAELQRQEEEDAGISTASGSRSSAAEDERDAELGAALQQELYGSGATSSAGSPRRALASIPHGQRHVQTSPPLTRSQWRRQAEDQVRGNAKAKSSALAIVPARRGQPNSDKAVVAWKPGGGVLTAVEQAQKRKRSSINADGSTEESQTQVHRRRTSRGDAPLEETTRLRDERIHKTKDGRTVVTEVVTVKKITYLK